MADTWRDVVGVPLRKGEDGVDVRPIPICEALMGLLAGCLKNDNAEEGTEAISLQSQALVELLPKDYLRGLDMTIAFGEMSRVAVLDEVIKELPELAPFVLLSWGDKGTPSHVPSDAAASDVLLLFDGLFQGHLILAKIISLWCATKLWYLWHISMMCL